MLGSVVDSVVTNADCDVLVERIGPEAAVESILVPTAGGPHAEFATEVAGAIARTTGATVEAVRVIDPGDFAPTVYPIIPDTRTTTKASRKKTGSWR